MKSSSDMPWPTAVMGVALVAIAVAAVSSGGTGLWPIVVTGISIAGLLSGSIIGIVAARRKRATAACQLDVIRSLARGDHEAVAAAEIGNDDLSSALAELKDALIEARSRDLQAAKATDLQRGSLMSMAIRVMVVDSSGKIVFVNDSLADHLAGIEDDIRSAIPDFRSDDVVGRELRMFDSELELTESGVTELSIGNQRLRLSRTALTGPDQEKVGVVIVWQDRTEEFQFEVDMETILSSAVEGDLSQRVDVTQQTGFSRRMADSVNTLLDLSESITNDTLRVFSAMAGGDLGETIDSEYQGAFDRLKQDANSTMRRLSEVVLGIQQSSEAVSTAFREINQGNMNLSQRTEQQASSLEETASSMEEMTGTVQKNADNAQQANELALKAREQAEKGGEVVGDAVGAMVDINEASRRIADIITVIDDIAFQTNLLALNASVEAARAGEQGRGFAVVAGEVRNLAGRSAEAAKEIKGLIEDSVSKVARGSKLVDESGQTLESIVKSVKQVTEIVADISTASLEQASGITQVNSTIAQMDDMTQQNAALVEQVSAASELASEQATKLRDLISFFGGGVEFSEPSFAPQTSADFAEIPATPAAPMVTTPRAANADFDSDWEEF